MQSINAALILLGFLFAFITYADGCKKRYDATKSWQVIRSDSGFPSCDLQFWTDYSSSVEVEVEADLPPRLHGACKWGKMELHEGISTYSDMIHMLCGTETGSVSSLGRALLVRYSKATGPGYYAGFRLRYRSVEDKYESSFDSDTSLGSKEVFGICAAVIFVVFLISGCAYFSCNNYNKLKSRMAENGYVPQDLRLTRITMLTQAREGTLTRISSSGRVVPATFAHVKYAINRWVKEGPVDQSCGDPLMVRVQQNMDFFSCQRRGEQSTLNAVAHNRVRHPAGDVHPNQIQLDEYPNPTDNQYSNTASAGASNNNVLTNNNTAANLNYPGQNGSSYFPYDHGHPQQAHVNPNTRHLSTHDLSDHRGSSGRIGAGGGSGRGSPHHSSVDGGGGHSTNSLGRRSPRHHQHPPFGDGVLTYYGPIEGRGSGPILPTINSSATDAFLGPHAASTNANTSAMNPEEPPPSYDEVTAGGRLTPHNRPVEYI